MIDLLKFYTKSEVNDTSHVANDTSHVATDTSHVANISYNRHLNSTKLWALKFWQ
jgi:hypothetical protein